MASSVGDVTRPAIKKTAAFTAVLKEPKNRKLVMGGIVAVAVAIAAIGWGLGGGGGDNSTSRTDVASGGSNPPGTAPAVNAVGSSGRPEMAITPFDEKQAETHQQA
jgi:hypothetical protein